MITREDVSRRRCRRDGGYGWYEYGSVMSSMCRKTVMGMSRQARRWKAAFGGGDIWKSDDMLALAWQDLRQQSIADEARFQQKPTIIENQDIKPLLKYCLHMSNKDYMNGFFDTQTLIPHDRTPPKPPNPYIHPGATMIHHTSVQIFLPTIVPMNLSLYPPHSALLRANYARVYPLSSNRERHYTSDEDRRHLAGDSRDRPWVRN